MTQTSQRANSSYVNETDQFEMIKEQVSWYLRETNQFETF